MATIELEEISKIYSKGVGSIAALSRFSLSVEAGETLALLGANGAGKSTAVRILSTLSRPDSGSARIAGFDAVAQVPQVRARIGVALQETGIYPAGRVRQVLRHHARLFGLDPGRRPAQRRNHRTRRPGQGRQPAGAAPLRRHAPPTRLGLALLHRPPVLLLDEPTSSLDPFSRHEFWRELGRLRDEGTCILFASQSLEETEHLADRVVLMAEGTIWRDDISVAAVRDIWAGNAVGS